jgi:DNA topoisomerase-3
MGKVLVIAEKPSVGRDIARVLKCSQKGEGFLYNDSYLVSWAIGHLVALQEPDEYDPRYKKWQMGTLPIVPSEMKLKVLPKTRKQFNLLKKLMNDKSVDSLICATDSGREGELIFRYIYQMAGCQKPFQRLWISSMTDEAIQDGLSKLKPGEQYNGLYESAKCRSEADWLVGMNASRAFTVMYNTLLSVGRVQTPTLSILVSRHKEIEEFTPQSCDVFSAGGIPTDWSLPPGCWML